MDSPYDPANPCEVYDDIGENASFDSPVEKGNKLGLEAYCSSSDMEISDAELDMKDDDVRSSKEDATVVGKLKPIAEIITNKDEVTAGKSETVIIGESECDVEKDKNKRDRKQSENTDDKMNKTSSKRDKANESVSCKDVIVISDTKDMELNKNSIGYMLRKGNFEKNTTNMSTADRTKKTGKLSTNLDLFEGLDESRSQTNLSKSADLDEKNEKSVHLNKISSRLDKTNDKGLSSYFKNSFCMAMPRVIKMNETKKDKLHEDYIEEFSDGLARNKLKSCESSCLSETVSIIQKIKDDVKNNKEAGIKKVAKNKETLEKVDESCSEAFDTNDRLKDVKNKQSKSKEHEVQSEKVNKDAKQSKGHKKEKKDKKDKKKVKEKFRSRDDSEIEEHRSKTKRCKSKERVYSSASGSNLTKSRDHRDEYGSKSKRSKIKDKVSSKKYYSSSSRNKYDSDEYSSESTRSRSKEKVKDKIGSKSTRSRSKEKVKNKIGSKLTRSRSKEKVKDKIGSKLTRSRSKEKVKDKIGSKLTRSRSKDKVKDRIGSKLTRSKSKDKAKDRTGSKLTRSKSPDKIRDKTSSKSKRSRSKDKIEDKISSTQNRENRKFSSKSEEILNDSVNSSHGYSYSSQSSDPKKKHVLKGKVAEGKVVRSTVPSRNKFSTSKRYHSRSRSTSYESGHSFSSSDEFSFSSDDDDGHSRDRYKKKKHNIRIAEITANRKSNYESFLRVSTKVMKPPEEKKKRKYADECDNFEKHHRKKQKSDLSISCSGSLLSDSPSPTASDIVAINLKPIARLKEKAKSQLKSLNDTIKETATVKLSHILDQEQDNDVIFCGVSSSEKLGSNKDTRRLVADKDTRRLAADKDTRRLAADKDTRRLAADNDTRWLAADKDTRKLAADKDEEKNRKDQVPVDVPIQIHAISSQENARLPDVTNIEQESQLNAVSTSGQIIEIEDKSDDDNSVHGDNVPLVIIAPVSSNQELISLEAVNTELGFTTSNNLTLDIINEDNMRDCSSNFVSPNLIDPNLITGNERNKTDELVIDSICKAPVVVETVVENAVKTVVETCVETAIETVVENAVENIEIISSTPVLTPVRNQDSILTSLEADCKKDRIASWVMSSSNQNVIGSNSNSTTDGIELDMKETNGLVGPITSTLTRPSSSNIIHPTPYHDIQNFTDLLLDRVCHLPSRPQISRDQSAIAAPPSGLLQENPLLESAPVDDRVSRLLMLHAVLEQISQNTLSALSSVQRSTDACITSPRTPQVQDQSQVVTFKSPVTGPSTSSVVTNNVALPNVPFNKTVADDALKSPAIIHFPSVSKDPCVTSVEPPKSPSEKNSLAVTASPLSVDETSPRSDEFDELFSPPPPPPPPLPEGNDEASRVGSSNSSTRKQKKKAQSSNIIHTENLDKSTIQKLIEVEVKGVLRPVYMRGKISKEEYKEIMKKAVPKICKSKRDYISKSSITIYIEGYVRKVCAMRKYIDKKQRRNKTRKS